MPQREFKASLGNLDPILKQKVNLDIVADVCHLSTWEAGLSGVQGQPQLPTKPKATLTIVQYFEVGHGGIWL